jgi:iron complex outermembrane receptor protein
VVSPRVGIVRKINDQISSYISISSGFSPPSTEEVRTSDGGINDQLDAERGINYEIGLRGNTMQKNLMFDISAFDMQQQQTIVSRILEGGNSTFENAGSTAQKGFEALIGYNFIHKTAGFLNLLMLKTAFTYNDFKFKNYIKESGGENVDYSGNALTGTAPVISVTTLDIAARSGIYANFTYNYTDRIPLDDANTAFANSYQLISAKLGYKHQFHHKLLFEIFTGVDNLLNEKYSLGNDLNAFGNRYYNPAPERNYFAGLRLMFNEI